MMTWDVLTDRLVGRCKPIVPRRAADAAVFMGYGHGDNMRGMAIASALRRKNVGHITAILNFTGKGVVKDGKVKLDGSIAEFDIAESAKEQGVIDDYVMNWGAPRQLAIPALANVFQTVYDAVPYPIGQFTRKGPVLRNMGFYKSLYETHPYMNNVLRLLPFNQWEIASQTLGFHVDELDMIAPTTLAPNPEGPEWEHLCEGQCDPNDMLVAMLARSPYYVWGAGTMVSGRYVVVHNSTGGGHAVKCADPAVFQAVRARLIADGVECVQVGDIADAAIEGAVDRRGMRLALTCQLIAGALAVVSVEGFIPYLGIAKRRPTVVLSGPTPAGFFDCASVTTLAAGLCPSCFWRHEKWGERCWAGHERCVNFVPPDMVAETVAGVVKDSAAREEIIREAEQAAIASARGLMPKAPPPGAATKERAK